MDKFLENHLSGLKNFLHHFAVGIVFGTLVDEFYSIDFFGINFVCDIAICYVLGMLVNSLGLAPTKLIAWFIDDSLKKKDAYSECIRTFTPAVGIIFFLLIIWILLILADLFTGYSINYFKLGLIITGLIITIISFAKKYNR